MSFQSCGVNCYSAYVVCRMMHLGPSETLRARIALARQILPAGAPLARPDAAPPPPVCVRAAQFMVYESEDLRKLPMNACT